MTVPLVKEAVYQRSLAANVGRDVRLRNALIPAFSAGGG